MRGRTLPERRRARRRQWQRPRCPGGRYSGRVDTSLYTHNSVDFTPSISHGAIAKIVLGVMLGLAALTVLSLLWMPLRVRRRGAFGRKASATLRSLYPIALGLGGWFLGVLIVMTTLPTVLLDNELLAVLSIGVPIGLASTGPGCMATGRLRPRPRGWWRQWQAPSSVPGWGSTQRRGSLR